MVQAVLLAGPERRRRWSADERAEILTAAFSPGAVVSQVARRYDVSTGLIYTWRRQSTVEVSAPGFVPATITEMPDRTLLEPAVFVEFPTGVVVRINSAAPAELAATVLRALR
ncbi:transposase [Rhizobium puerariae]|uniref:Transposase n=1 Tax=Rhizobium puerariae TaxID=1585791 RepID=A0ABV6AG51_9HYPH